MHVTVKEWEKWRVWSGISSQSIGMTKFNGTTLHPTRHPLSKNALRSIAGHNGNREAAHASPAIKRAKVLQMTKTMTELSKNGRPFKPY